MRLRVALHAPAARPRRAHDGRSRPGCGLALRAADRSRRRPDSGAERRLEGRPADGHRGVPERGRRRSAGQRLRQARGGAPDRRRDRETHRPDRRRRVGRTAHRHTGRRHPSAVTELEDRGIPAGATSAVPRHADGHRRPRRVPAPDHLAVGASSRKSQPPRSRRHPGVPPSRRSARRGRRAGCRHRIGGRGAADLRRRGRDVDPGALDPEHGCGRRRRAGCRGPPDLVLGPGRREPSVVGGQRHPIRSGPGELRPRSRRSLAVQPPVRQLAAGSTPSARSVPRSRRSASRPARRSH